MKNIIALIDTNVIINFITKREDPYNLISRNNYTQVEAKGG